MKKGLALCSAILLLVIWASWSARHQRSTTDNKVATETVKPTTPYTLPAELSLDAHAERGPEGEVFVVGPTNFPDGMKLDVEVKSGRPSFSDAWVRNGTFRTTALWQEVLSPYYSPKIDSVDFKFLKKPFQVGNYKVHFTAYFNDSWQTPDVLTLLGRGGKNLHGKILKLTDPDVIDSDKELDDLMVIAFPPLQPEAKAINLVKSAVLTVPGQGRSSMDIGSNVKFNMRGMAILAPGLPPAKGWSAVASNADTYEVMFDFANSVDGKAVEERAIWSVDLKTGSVRYVNENAKNLSWTPNY